MPRARKKEDRLRQVFRWLLFSYPTPYPVMLKFVKGTKPRSDQGYVNLNRRKLVIHVDIKYPLHACIDTLLHEMAHAVSWRHASLDAYCEIHSDEWGLALAKIYRNFNDDGGDEESWEF